MSSQPLPIAADVVVGSTLAAVRRTVPAPPIGNPEAPELVRPICRLTASPRIGVVPVNVTGAPSCRTPPPFLYSPIELASGTLIVSGPAAASTRIELGACVPVAPGAIVRLPAPSNVYAPPVTLKLPTLIAPGTVIVPAPVAVKMAESPAADQVAPVQFRLVVSQVKLDAPLSQLLSAAADGPARARSAI